MDLSRMIKTDTEEFNEWLNSEIAEEFLAMDEDNFFITAEDLLDSSNQ